MTSARPKHWIESPFLWILLIGISFAMPLIKSFNREPAKTPPVLGRMVPFELVGKDGEKFSYTLISGATAIFVFVDADCGEPCAAAEAEYLRLQKSLKGAGPTARIVAVTTKPETNDPAALTKLATRLGDFAKPWFFLTGTPAQIQEFLFTNMKLPRPTGDLSEYARRGHVVLVDPIGQIRAHADLSTKDALNPFILDVAVVINTFPPKPTPQAR